MSTPHTGQRDPPPAPRPLPGGESQSCGWWERPTDPWQVREGQGGMAGLLVSRKGVIAEEKAEQPPENQAGTASVSLLLREPRAAVAALALEGARETPTGLLTPHWESPPPRGQCPSLPPTPDIVGLHCSGFEGSLRLAPLSIHCTMGHLLSFHSQVLGKGCQGIPRLG